MSRRWIIPLALLALLIPVGAVALDRSSGGLDVRSSLEGCGVAGDTVFCHISASFDEVEGGEFYTATVTRPDSTVQDFGRVPTAGSASLWIPYAGNGAYAVEITAWGRNADGEPTEVAKETGTSETGDGAGQGIQEDSLEPGTPGLPPLSDLEESGLLPACDTTEGELAPAGDEPGAPADGGERGGPSGGEPDQTNGGAPDETNAGEGSTADPGSGDGAAAQPDSALNPYAPSLCDEPTEDANGPCCPDSGS